MDRVLITGSTGLIGRWTKAAWPAELKAEVLDHREHDLTDAAEFVAVVRDSRPDVLLHLAWCASGTPGYRSSADNARWAASTLSAARFCLDRGIRFVGTGTVVDEGHPTDPYAIAKQELRTRLEPAIADGTIAWLRPFYVFDPEAGRPALVEASRAAAAAGGAVELRSAGSFHDFIHAADVGTAVVAALAHGLTGRIDIGSGQQRSVREMATACGARVADLDRQPDRDSSGVADTSLLRSTGWTPARTDQFFAAANNVVISD